MKRLFLSSIFAVVMLLPAGCVHHRNSAFSSVEGEVQKITTRNRYTLVYVARATQSGNADIMGMQAALSTNDDLKRYQPDVFADDGIKITYGDVKTLYNEYSNNHGGILTLLNLLTLGAFPQCTTGGSGYRFTMDILDNPDARATFDLYDRCDMAFATWTPLPLLCHMGSGSPVDGALIGTALSRHSVGFGDPSSPNSVNENLAMRHMISAYSIAALLKKMEDDGLIDDSHGKFTSCQLGARSSFADDKFEMVDFKREDDGGRRYFFSLKRRDSTAISLRESRDLQKMLRSMIREDYQASFPDSDYRSLVVDLPEFSLRGNEITGRAAVLSLTVESLRYDPHTRLGTMRLRIGENQFEDARRYARRNIESLVRDKNVALDAHAIPSAATFYLQDEKLKGDVLEIVFRAE